MKRAKNKVTTGSKNVFADLGFAPTEARDLQLRSELMIRLRGIVHGRRQKDIAAALGVSQPRVSDLFRGKLHLFSLDSLIGMLEKLGATVRVVVVSGQSRAGGESVAPIRSTSAVVMLADRENTDNRVVERDATWRSVLIEVIARSHNRNDVALLRDQAA